MVWVYPPAMDVIYFILLLASVLCFAFAAYGRSSVDADPRAGTRALGLVPLGLFFFALVPLIEAGRVVFD